MRQIARILEAFGVSELSKKVLNSAWGNSTEIDSYEAMTSIVSEAFRRVKTEGLNPVVAYGACKDLARIMPELLSGQKVDIEPLESELFEAMQRPLSEDGLRALFDAQDREDALERIATIKSVLSWAPEKDASFIAIDPETFVLREVGENWPFTGEAGTSFAGPLHASLVNLNLGEVLDQLPAKSLGFFQQAAKDAKFPDDHLSVSYPSLDQGLRTLDGVVFAFNRALAVVGEGSAIDPSMRESMRAQLPNVVMTAMGIRANWQLTKPIDFHHESLRLEVKIGAWPFANNLSMGLGTPMDILASLSATRVAEAAASHWPGETGVDLAHHFAEVLYDHDIQLPSAMQLHRRAKNQPHSVEEVFAAADRKEGPYSQISRFADGTKSSEVKLHVYCESPLDVREAMRRIFPSIVDRGLPFKVTTLDGFDLNLESQTQRNKGITIYLPEGDLNAEAKAIADRLVGYAHAGGKIPGDHFYGNGVSCRSTPSGDRYVVANVDTPGPEVLRPYVAPAVARDTLGRSGKQEQTPPF